MMEKIEKSFHLSLYTCPKTHTHRHTQTYPLCLAAIDVTWGAQLKTNRQRASRNFCFAGPTNQKRIRHENCLLAVGETGIGSQVDASQQMAKIPLSCSRCSNFF